MMIRSRAPLRLGIAGGGTDVSPFSDEHGGVVLNATLSMYAYAVLEPTNDHRVTFKTSDRLENFSSEAIPFLDPEGEMELRLHKGVYNRIVRDFNHGEPLSLKLTTFSDAKAGSGLGTSSTMVVAIIKAFTEWLNLPLGDYDMAQLAYDIERKDLGFLGGKQDQYAATFGGFNFMEFYEKDRVIVNPLRVKNWILSELETSLVLYFTGSTRDSAKIIEDQVENAKDSTKGTLAALQALKKDAYEMKESLLKGDLRKFGEILDRSWQEKKNLASSISTPLIETKYNLAKDAGAYAGKVSGAGGGGFMFFMVDPEHRMDVIRALSDSGGMVMNCHFTKHGSEGWKI